MYRVNFILAGMNKTIRIHARNEKLAVSKLRVILAPQTIEVLSVSFEKV